jgi:hypothetical protein
VTLRDAYRELAAVGSGSTGGRVSDDAITVAGLRGGRLIVGAQTVRLDRYEVVRASGLRAPARGGRSTRRHGVGRDGLLQMRSRARSAATRRVPIRYRPLPSETR